MEKLNSHTLPILIDGFETGEHLFQLDFGDYKGEIALRLHTNATKHARGFVRCSELLNQIHDLDVRIAGIATTPNGHDYLVILNTTKAVLADQDQLEPWGYDEYIEMTRQTTDIEVISI